MYVQILNPIDAKTHVSPKEAERLVYRGAAAFVGEGRKVLRYLEHYESMRLRAEISRASSAAMFDRITEPECKARVWKTVHSGKKRMAGGPKYGVKQFVTIHTSTEKTSI